MTTDEKKMYFVTNIEADKNEDGECSTYEYEINADAHFVGLLSYGPYDFYVWELLVNKRAGEERKLCLRIRERITSKDPETLQTAREPSYYHIGGIAEELVSLASLFVRRRLKLGPLVRRDDTPFYYSKKQYLIDKPLVTGHSNLADLSDWLKLVEGLDRNYHQRFILSVRLYHQALLLIEEQPDMAYLNLVSAIEVLCRDTDIEVSLADIDQKIAKLVSQVEDEDLRNKIEQAIMKREAFIQRKFVTFILKHIEDDFWTEGERPVHGKIKPEQLPVLLKRIYDQRSRSLHNGELFPPQVFLAPLEGSEIDPSLRMSVGGRKWEQKDYIPNPHFFERVVNHVLKTFIKNNQAKGENVGKS